MKPVIRKDAKVKVVKIFKYCLSVLYQLYLFLNGLSSPDQVTR